MPWEETNPEMERTRFVVEVEQGVFRIQELCERYGVSRKTAYKWLTRFRAEGLEGLSDRSRKPHHCPHRTPPEVEDRIEKLRRKYPYWGPETLRIWLQRHEPNRRWPASSTIGEILKRKRLIKGRQRRRPHPSPSSGVRVETDAPNQVFSVDFKGEFLTRDGCYCYPLTVQDHCSRFSLCCQGLESPARVPVQRKMVLLFRRYGLPGAILSDNGPPFASYGLGRLSRLSVWWIRLGIRPLLIQPGHPEQNGRHERFHRTLKQHTALPPAGDLKAQQKVFDGFRQEYNHQRPHQQLGGLTPGDRYQPSARVYPERLPPLEYPGHYEIRKVNKVGSLTLHNQKFFLTRVLEGQRVGLEEIEDGLWSVYLTDLLIGRLDQRTGKVYG